MFLDWSKKARVKAALCWFAILLSNVLVLALLAELTQPSPLSMATMFLLGPLVFGLPWFVMLQRER